MRAIEAAAFRIRKLARKLHDDAIAFDRNHLYFCHGYSELTAVNAPERITSLVVAPGVVLLHPGNRVDLAARQKAASAIMRQMARARPLPKGMSGADLLQQVRDQRAGAALRP